MKALISHPNYTQADLEYLKSKGYSNSEILGIWDRDLSESKGAVKHNIDFRGGYIAI